MFDVVACVCEDAEDVDENVHILEVGELQDDAEKGMEAVE